jgi:hypothetical protein
MMSADAARIIPERFRGPSGEDRKLSIVIEAFTPHHSNTLFGFVTITIPEIHLRICDLTVHEQNGKRWIGLPAKPQVGRDGAVRRDERGKTAYTPILQFTDPKTREAFSRRVIAALLEFAPSAFEEEPV